MQFLRHFTCMHANIYVYVHNIFLCGLCTLHASKRGAQGSLLRRKTSQPAIKINILHHEKVRESKVPRWNLNIEVRGLALLLPEEERGRERKKEGGGEEKNKIYFLALKKNETAAYEKHLNLATFICLDVDGSLSSSNCSPYSTEEREKSAKKNS